MDDHPQSRRKLPGSLFAQCLVVDLFILAIFIAYYDAAQILVAWKCLLLFPIGNLVLGYFRFEKLAMLNALRITFNILTLVALGEFVFICRTAQGVLAPLGIVLALLTLMVYLAVALILAGIYTYRKRRTATST